ncbi:TetR family transcriptional regulator [Streptomyces ipomoeae]|uniref:TetR family transcriptional regulator n=1 Tax=Streptomyces ipomoeae TaxID=103232 RepID=UPI001146BAA3|nr:TetR family transcriptional regulator [Streptomyces ipomoeae]MDX2937733.1 TetR family transcriptional regulator [Streptomyces ipomoeae]TQE17259.1 TetR family transcriptional regulator [Streptomyces ipomoeae]
MEMTPHEQVGARLRAARQAHGMSLRALAGRIGVSPATMSQLERGRTGLSVTRLGEIARVLGTTANALLDGAPPTSPVERRPPAPPAARQAQADPDPDWRSYPPRPFDPVLEAALAEFLEVGYHGTSVRGIAQRCGLSVSGLYHHYASKQEMLRQILDLTMSDLLRRSRAARAEGRDPVERFCLIVENLALYHTRRRELGFVGASEMRSLAPDNHRAIAALRTEQQRMVDFEVAAASAAGRFRTRHPQEAGRAVVTMCTALAQWYRPGGDLSPEGIAAEYVQFALDLMRFRPHP